MLAQPLTQAQGKKILVVEDDKIISFSIKHQLETKGFIVHQAFKGDAANRMVIRHTPDCILLDIGLPNVNGYQVCATIREFYHGPIIFLTGNDTVEAELKCLQLGADDFINKDRPFTVILARVLRLLEKKEAPIANNSFAIGLFIFDKYNHICQFNNQNISLTNDEYQLLYYLLIYQDTVVTREQTYQTLKGISYNGVSRSMDISISRLKSKLVAAGMNAEIIQTIRSQGYRFSTLSLLTTKTSHLANGASEKPELANTPTPN